MTKSQYLSIGLFLAIIILAIVLGVTQSGTVELTVDAPEGEAVADSQEGAYIVDAEQSEIQWAGSKTFIDGYTDIGTVDVAEGVINIDNGDLAGGSIIIDMTTITATNTGRGSGEERLSGRLQSEDFFAIEQYPTASYIITEVTETDEEGIYMVVGDMTIKDTTTAVDALIELRETEENIIVVAELSINRTRFNVRFGSDKFFDNLGNNTIDDEFTLDIVLQAPLTQ